MYSSATYCSLRSSPSFGPLSSALGSNERVTVVSAFAGATALGAYLLGLRIAQLVPIRVMSILNEVLLPTLSRIRASGGSVVGPYLESIRAAALPTALANFAALALAAPGVALIGGDRWQSAVVCVQVLALFGILQAITSPATPFVQMQGVPGASLRQAAASYALLWGIGLPAIYYGGLVAFLFAVLFIMVFAWAYVGRIVGRIGGPSIGTAARAAAPTLATCALPALLILALVELAPLRPFETLFIGALLYGSLALAFDHALFAGANLARVRHFARLALGPSLPAKSP